jgi:Holliday junction resolvasome RuvABC ATP-dependent DNA helicase subunit
VGEVIGRQRARARSEGVQAIAKMAAGVPLFAVELSKHYGGEMLALPLLVVVCARLDSLRLDRKMLRAVARSFGSLALAEVADALGEDAEAVRQAAERALVAGGMTLGPDGRLSFSHPLLRQVIEYLSME